MKSVEAAPVTRLCLGHEVDMGTNRCQAHGGKHDQEADSDQSHSIVLLLRVFELSVGQEPSRTLGRLAN